MLMVFALYIKFVLKIWLDWGILKIAKTKGIVKDDLKRVYLTETCQENESIRNKRFLCKEMERDNETSRKIEDAAKATQANIFYDFSRPTMAAPNIRFVDNYCYFQIPTTKQSATLIPS
jgi:hypothetical protein